MHYLAVALAIIVAYFLGTFPSALLVAKANGVNIVEAGSGNPGASNVARTLGARKGAMVYGLDASKGALAAFLGLSISGVAGGYLAAAAALVGHVYPVTRRFKGGKGVATGSGAMSILQPLVSMGLLVLWFIVSKTTKKAALASLSATIGLPIAMAMRGAPGWEVTGVSVVGVLVVVRHIPNLRRLYSGHEHSLKGKGT